MIDVKSLLRDFKAGCGFEPNDVLRPRDGVAAWMEPIRDDTVVVLDHQYDPTNGALYRVLGERKEYKGPANRFVTFTINGHEWQKVGRA